MPQGSDQAAEDVEDSMLNGTASQIIGQSQTPVTTRSGLWIGFPQDMFTADVTLDGRTHTLLFDGTDHHDLDAVPVAQFTRVGIANWTGELTDGRTTRFMTIDDGIRAAVALLRR